MAKGQEQHLRELCSDGKAAWARIERWKDDGWTLAADVRTADVGREVGKGQDEGHTTEFQFYTVVVVRSYLKLFVLLWKDHF